MRYVLVNDVHLSDRPPASCTETYLDDLFDLLDQVGTIANKLDADIILAGDVFHHKAPTRTSHGCVNRLISWAKSCVGTVWAVPGNHDLQHDRVASLDSQPLGVAFASGAIERLDGWIDDGSGPFVYGVPWQMTFDDANVTDALLDFCDGYKGDPALVVTHAPLYPPGRELKYEFYPAEKWAEAMDGHGSVHYGHVHEPHGIYTVGGVTFSNPGALSRGSLHEHNLTRVPAVAIWDSNTGRFEHLPLRAKPADQVFRLQEAAEVKQAGINLTGFLDSVRTTRLDVTSTASVIEHVESTHSDDRALVAVVRKLLEEAT